MAQQDSVSRPIQVFQNTEQFFSVPERRGGGGRKDFFEGNDSGFSQHKSAMRQKIQDSSPPLPRNGQGVAFIIVQMSNEELARSCRPLVALLSSANSLRLVGGGKVGVLFLHVRRTPSTGWTTGLKNGANTRRGSRRKLQRPGNLNVVPPTVAAHLATSMTSISSGSAYRVALYRRSNFGT